METFAHVATQMLILLAFMAAGAVLRRIGVLKDRAENVVSRLVMNIILPAMILASVLTSETLPDPATIGMLLLWSLLSYGVAVVLAELLPRLYCRTRPDERGAHAFSVAFGNVGFMGLPVLGSIFGAPGVLYGAIFNIPFNLYVFTIGVHMVSRKDEAGDSGERGKTSVLRSLASPTVIASLAAIVLCLLHVNATSGPVGAVGSALHAIGQLTTPGAMIVIGSMLAKMSLKSTLSKPLPYLSCLLRLVIVPLVIYALFSLLRVEPLVLGALTIGAGMPVATLGGMLSLVHGGDTETIARTTFISTVCSLVTIPLIALLVA